MKKMVIVLVFALLSCMSKASQDNCVDQKENSQKSHQSCFGDADQSIDEYVHNEENQNDIDEYDQHVCDDVKPPKISNAQIFLTNILGKLLVHYLIMKETANIYFHELKDILNSWFNNRVK